jgi:DNA-nicking Smr family endonuclease
MEEQPTDREPVELPVESSLDLHAFSPRDMVEVVASYLEEAAARGLREVRLIHGKGIGVQRERIRSLVSRHPLVERLADAPAERGHWGATIVWLRVGNLDAPDPPAAVSEVSVRPTPDEGTSA